ncbi:hypothetical protein [Butyricicoccus intestinisimiae]
MATVSNRSLEQVAGYSNSQKNK